MTEKSRAPKKPTPEEELLDAIEDILREFAEERFPALQSARYARAIEAVCRNHYDQTRR